MAFTKINAAGIGSTETVTLDGLTVINDGSFGGNVSVGGTLTYEDVTNIDSVGLITARAGVVVGSGITLSKDGDIFATGVTTSTTFVGALTGNVTGNATGLSGTPNISAGTISGSTGTFSGAVSGTTGTFTGDVDIADKIIHTGDTNTALRFPAADTITAETGGTERLRIDSGGRIGIKNTSPSSQYFNNLVVGDNSSGDWGITIRTNSSNKGVIAFSDTDAADANRYDGFIAYHHNDQSMRFNTGGANERLRINSGGQIGIRNTNASSFNSGGDDLVIGNATDGADAGITLYSHSSDNCSIFFNDTADTGITGLIQYRHDVDAMRIFTATAERLRIDSSGRLLLGTTSVGDGNADELTVAGASDSGITIRSGSSNYGQIYFSRATSGTGQYEGYLAYQHSTDSLQFGTDHTERLRIASDGKTTVKVNDSNTTRVNATHLQIQNSNFGASACAGIMLAASNGSNTEFNIVTQKHASGSGADFHLDNGTNARMQMSGDNGDIKFGVNGTMITSYTPGNGNSVTGIGMEARNGSIFLSRSDGASLYLNVNTDGGYLARFARNGNEQGKIIAHSMSVSYETTSDYRVKENAVAISDGITRLKQLKPYRFNFKSNSSETLDGFFAHEAQTVVPECASGTKDQVVVQAQVDSEVYKESELGNPIYQGIDQSKLVPLLTAALQEAIVEIESLKEEVAALKG
tara:strand:- start:82 stop:2166 length:2085 start_codon:yes stop_codon:yes gene_type:complete